MTAAAITVVRARLDRWPSDPAGLSIPERARAAAMPATAARQFVGGRGLLRRVLGEALGIEPTQVALEEGAAMKPRLVGDTALDFNVSHGGEWLLVAIARGCRVGVDVEPRVPARDESAIADALGAWPGACPRDQDFTQRWARLEAMCKVDGRGLTLPLDPDVGAGLTVVDLPLDSGHAAALAWSGSPDRVTEIASIGSTPVLEVHS